MVASNDDMGADWALKAQAWVRNARIFDAAFTPFTRAILDSAALQPGMRVLDVGCGAGTLLQAAVEAGAEAVGVDISPGMTEAAGRRVPEATTVTADAQTSNLLSQAPGKPFDRVVSRFGVMFFADPVAAFTNIRSSVAEDGRLTFVCWRSGETDMFRHGMRSLIARLEDSPEPMSEGVPGPLGLADEDRIRQVLTDAGWSQVAVEPLDEMVDFSVDGSDGVDERLSIILAGSIGQMARAELEPRLGEVGWHEVLEETRAELRADLVDGSVAFRTRAQLVTAVSDTVTSPN